MLINTENTIVAIIMNTLGIFVNIIAKKHIANMMKVNIFIIEDLKNLIKEGTINAHTPQARPFNKLCTSGYV